MSEDGNFENASFNAFWDMELIWILQGMKWNFEFLFFTSLLIIEDATTNKKASQTS